MVMSARQSHANGGYFQGSRSRISRRGIRRGRGRRLEGNGGLWGENEVVDVIRWCDIAGVEK